MSRLDYAKVIMKLEDMLQGDFFNEYIKRGNASDILASQQSRLDDVHRGFWSVPLTVILPGNVLMLSEGQNGVDEVLSLSEGTSTLRPRLRRKAKRGPSSDIAEHRDSATGTVQGILRTCGSSRNSSPVWRPQACQVKIQ